MTYMHMQMRQRAHRKPVVVHDAARVTTCQQAK